MGEREAEQSWKETEGKREGKGKSENEDEREQEGNDEGVEERRGLRSPGAPWAFLVFY